MRFKKIYIEINNTCNFNCSFCIHTTRKKKYMSIDEFKHVINEVKDYSDYVYFHLMGEPLIHPKLNEFITIAKNEGLLVNITTNGSLLLEHLDMFINNPVRQINISLHSIESENEVFYKYVDDIIKCVKHIHNNTKTHIAMRLWDIMGENDSRHDYILDKLSREFSIEINNVKLKNYQSLVIADDIFLNMDKRFIWPSLDLDVVSTKGRCLGMKDMVSILVDGSVCACCLDSNGDTKMGNIFEDSFKDIIECDRAKNMVDGFYHRRVVEPLCQRCMFKSRFK